eukprot:Rhum_TRINITY_DN14639_c7_g2::Rhum_TRINITY_DN14639_c7_g2_i1::g.106733::m.106733
MNSWRSAGNLSSGYCNSLPKRRLMSSLPFFSPCTPLLTSEMDTPRASDTGTSSFQNSPRCSFWFTDSTTKSISVCCPSVDFTDDSCRSVSIWKPAAPPCAVPAFIAFPSARTMPRISVNFVSLSNRKSNARVKVFMSSLYSLRCFLKSSVNSHRFSRSCRSGSCVPIRWQNVSGGPHTTSGTFAFSRVSALISSSCGRMVRRPSNASRCSVSPSQLSIASKMPCAGSFMKDSTMPMFCARAPEMAVDLFASADFAAAAPSFFRASGFFFSNISCSSDRSIRSVFPSFSFASSCFFASVPHSESSGATFVTTCCFTFFQWSAFILLFGWLFAMLGLNPNCGGGGMPPGGGGGGMPFPGRGGGGGGPPFPGGGGGGGAPPFPGGGGGGGGAPPLPG